MTLTSAISRLAKLVVLLAAAAAHSAEPPRIVQLCAGCHGLDGVGKDVGIPNIAGQSGIYLKRQLRAFRTGQRRHPQMWVTASSLTDRDIEQIVSYFALIPGR
jgi:cytochrome c553